MDGLQGIGAELPGVGVVVGHHPAKVGPGLDTVRVATRPHRPGLLYRAGLGNPARVAPEHCADLAGGYLGLLHHALGRVGLEHHDRAGRPAVVGLAGRHVGTDGLVPHEVVGVGEGTQRVLLAPDDVLQRDVGDVTDVPDRRQVGEQVPGDDRLARLPLVLHVVRLTLHPERRRHLHEVHDLAVVMVRRTVDVRAADVDHDHGVETADPLLGADVEETGRADRSLVDEAHPVVAAHVADVALAGPHDGILRLAAGGGRGSRRLEPGDGRVAGLEGARDEALGHGRDVIGVVDGLDLGSGILEGFGDRVGLPRSGRDPLVGPEKPQRSDNDDGGAGATASGSDHGSSSGAYAPLSGRGDAGTRVWR